MFSVGGSLLTSLIYHNIFCKLKCYAVGNGCPYMGRIYSRAVILLWPRANREAIEMQTKGGRAVKNGSSS